MQSQLLRDFSTSKSSHFNRNLNDLEFCVMVKDFLRFRNRIRHIDQQKAVWFESDFYGPVYTWYSDSF